MINVFLDFETDGLNTETCQITQYAVVTEEGTPLVVRTCGVFLGEYQPPDDSLKAFSYTGYDLKQAEELNFPVFDLADWRLITNLIENKNVQCWAHNSAFDKSVWEAITTRLGLVSLKKPWGCTMELACKTPHVRKHPQQTRLKLPNYSFESTAHDALSDAKNCALLYQHCNFLGRFAQGIEPKSLDF